MTNANLSGAIVSANLTGAHLIGADLIHAHLTGANLSRVNLMYARTDERARRPEGIVPSAPCDRRPRGLHCPTSEGSFWCVMSAFGTA
ncbi:MULTISPECIES: pentapeptide repeat-containing protein [unclassified Micromonospora]|uniref:pentapeptide repeat-containing protein n=1 Tax=unclassified Micromonospora TaxID=2617518 RepID=UPI00098CF0B9|nr:MULTISPECIES: pentapeptide repeat-containing protein [unclassified Micromonospora]MDI5936640.1 pentapeptide repeat-containing protein [Micromonospora sp. DH15]OON32479.1 hypothetical protein BSA16_05550 [Micromonospora sp. Rc5]